MNNIYEIIASLAECFIVVRFCSRFLTYKNKKYFALKSAIIFLFLAADNILLSQLPGYEGLSVFLLILGIFIYSFSFLRGCIYEKILTAIMPTLTLLPINLIVLHTFSLVSGANVSELINTDENIRIMILFFTKFLFFLICEIIIKVKKRGEYSFSGYQWVIQLCCFIISFLISNSLWNVSKSFDNIQSDFIFNYFMIALLNVLLYILLIRMEKDNVSKEQYRIMKLKLNSQKQQYIDMSKQYKEAKILRHDISHCLTAVSELISNERYKDAQNYVESFLHEKVDTSAFVVNTGNSVIDAVINNKISVCKKNNVQIKCIIDTEIKSLDETDISILLSNMLDNAISGTLKCGEPMIELSVQNKKSYILISVKNRIAVSVLENNPYLKTQKQDKLYHGYGIMSTKK